MMRLFYGNFTGYLLAAIVAGIVAAAKALQKRGTRYCAEKKQAQGIRMFANALKLLGVAPADQDR